MASTTSADLAVSSSGRTGERRTLSDHRNITANTEPRTLRRSLSGLLVMPLLPPVSLRRLPSDGAIGILTKQSKSPVLGDWRTQRHLLRPLRNGVRSIRSVTPKTALGTRHASEQTLLNAWTTQRSSSETDGCATSAAKPWTCHSRSTTRCHARSTTSFPSQREDPTRWTTSSCLTSAVTPGRERGN